MGTVRRSKQKEIIYNALLEEPCHPTADTLYNKLKPENPNLSLATVYRNLNQFASQGKILKIRVPDGSDRFDGSIHKHFHGFCTQCGEVFDIEAEELEGIEEKIMNISTFKVTQYILVIYGICNKCREKEIH